jgi:hypothetical protein
MNFQQFTSLFYAEAISLEYKHVVFANLSVPLHRYRGIDYSIEMNHTIFYDVSYTVYQRFLSSGTLWFAKHNVFVL